MHRSKRVGAEDSSPRLSRRARTTLGLAVASVLLLAVTASALPISFLGKTSVGHPLRLHPGGSHVVPITAPAAIGRVAVVPGSKHREAWAFGFVQSLKPGWDSSSPDGQLVFLRTIDSHPWEVAGPPISSSGHVVNTTLSAISMACTGEGWAVGPNGVLVHRLPGGSWILQNSSPTTSQLNTVSVGCDARGVFGFAAGAGISLLKLSGSTWSVDASAGPTGSNQAVPDFVSVSAVDRNNGWAVAQQVPNQLSLWQRQNGVWTRKTTGKPIFDSPPAPIVSGPSGTVNQYAQGSGIWANKDSMWVVGRIQPVDAAQAANNSVSTEKSRAFALHYDVSSDSFTSYCPRLYQLSNSGVTQTTDVCDKPFPFAVGELPVLQGFSGGDALAGGYGFFRFHDGAWKRQPSVTGYMSSGSFSSSDDGWVASPGGAFSATGAAVSSSLTLGHWTTEADPAPLMLRWATPARPVLESVAADPSGAERAMSVGAEGTIVLSDARFGVDMIQVDGRPNLHSIAWPSAGDAWAVGESGTILHFDGTSWKPDPASRKLTDQTLFSVAFASTSRGFAVGTKGTVLGFDGSAWHVDRASGKITSKKLSAVAAAGNDVIAVGDNGTAIKDSGNGFVALATVKRLVAAPTDPGGEANLLSVAGLPDGTAYIGGSHGALLERRGRGAFVHAELPSMYGSIHTLALSRAPDGRVTVYASLGSGASKYTNYGLADAVGWLFAGVDGQWVSVAPGRVAPSDPSVDAPVKRDGVFGIAAIAGGRAWAVGGFPTVGDADGHAYTSTSSSLWRVDLSGDPLVSPEEIVTRPETPENSVSFAFASDFACASGLCGNALGLGARGDEMMTHALADIDSLAQAGLVRFVALGGDLRRVGFPDELETVKPIFDDLSVPAFAALGDRDLFGGVTAGNQSALTSPGYYLSTFADRPKPWGQGKALPAFIPVNATSDGQPAAGQARTHYAFDYAPLGRPLIRVVFFDTSRTPLAASTQNPQSSEESWLSEVLASATTPAVVVMHQPLVTGLSNDPDASALTSLLTAGHVSLVLAGHHLVNEETFVGAGGVGFPAIAAGTTGGLLGGGWNPVKGAYNSWQLVSIVARAGGLVGPQASVSVRSMPILESVALDAPEGRSTTAGSALRFRALGRTPDTGSASNLGPSADGNELHTTYLGFPYPRTCGTLENPDQVSCTPANVERPDYAFSCADRRICAFIREDPARPGHPFRDTDGAMIADAQGGLMCAFRTGTTYVSVKAGLVGSRMPVSVTTGSGECFPDIIKEAPPAFAMRPKPRPVVEAERRYDSFRPHPLRVRTAPILPAPVPPPIVNPVPAPPGAPGVGKKEEVELAPDSEGHSNEHAFTALSHHRDALPDPWMSLGALMLFAFMGASITVAARERRYSPARQR